MKTLLLSIHKQYITTLKQQLKILIAEPCDRNPPSQSESTYTYFKLPIFSLILKNISMWPIHIM